MKNCRPLGLITQEFIPEYFDAIDWNGIWNRKLESGTAFEWTVFSALIKTAKDHGISVTMPLIEHYNAGEFFILRNEIPFTHGAQAGNSASALSSKGLKERFFYSLVPKAVFFCDNQYYSVFREGCPYHKIMCGQNYLERTDIIIMAGNTLENYPQLNTSGNEVNFAFQNKDQKVSGTLRVRNSPFIPCKIRYPRQNVFLEPAGIIECSVNKTAETAAAQLDKYDALFSNGEHHPAFSLITGNDLSSMAYDTHQIHLEEEDPAVLKNELLTSALGILQNFSIIDP